MVALRPSRPAPKRRIREGLPMMVGWQIKRNIKTRYDIRGFIVVSEWKRKGGQVLININIITIADS
jgi:hypothetical protein